MHLRTTYIHTYTVQWGCGTRGMKARHGKTSFFVRAIYVQRVREDIEAYCAENECVMSCYATACPGVYLLRGLAAAQVSGVLIHRWATI